MASLTILAAFVTAGAIQAGSTSTAKAPVVKNAKAFDVSKPLRELAKSHKPSGKAPKQHPRGNVDRSPTIEGASASELSVSGADGSSRGADTLAVGPTIANFEGLSNQDNFNVFGFRVNPPDPVGDVGPNHYVEMINLVFAVYSKPPRRFSAPWIRAPFGTTSRSRTAPIPQVTRSSSTTSSRTAGS